MYSFPPHEGLCVPRVEVLCPHPRSEATGITIQVSSLCYCCPLLHSNTHIHENMGVQPFAYHISALTTSFDSMLAGVRYPLVRQLGRYLC